MTKTIARLWKDKPAFIIVATPPVIAALPVYVYARARRIPFLLDAHTGVFDDPRWTWLLCVSRSLSRAATATIVTNEHLARIVRSWGGEAVVIGIVPVTFSRASQVARKQFNIVVVSTFSRDEPVETVVKAARNVPNILVYITGDVRRAPQRLRESATPNVRFTGWLSDEEYVDLLNGATAVMVLTTRDHTMQRGAYEAMALEKPVITSDWPLLRETFNKGTIHVDNSVSSITKAIETAVRRHESLSSEMKLLRQKSYAEFQVKLTQLLSLVKSH